ncbi:MAG: HAD hydrolase-like protein [Clostridia bacterium]|nr:HAD hydrolase-like protein [Clostridia bacterium]
MKIKSVIFDLDGTLLNTLDDLRDSVNHVLAAHSMPARTLSEIRRFVGNGIPKLIYRAVSAGTSPAEAEACVAEMLAYYAAHCEIKTAPYDGILPLLDALKNAGIRTAVVTNKDHTAAAELCGKMFGDRLSAVIGAAPGRKFKPAPDGVWEAMRLIDAKADSTVYVGDSDVDMLTAANAGLPAVAVLWGFRDRDALEQFSPFAVCENAEDLRKIVL